MCIVAQRYCAPTEKNGLQTSVVVIEKRDFPRTENRSGYSGDRDSGSSCVPGASRVMCLIYSTCFTGLDLLYADPAQPLTMAGEELHALDHDLCDLSVLGVKYLSRGVFHFALLLVYGWSSSSDREFTLPPSAYNFERSYLGANSRRAAAPSLLCTNSKSRSATARKHPGKKKEAESEGRPVATCDSPSLPRFLRGRAVTVKYTKTPYTIFPKFDEVIFSFGQIDHDIDHVDPILPL